MPASQDLQVADDVDGDSMARTRCEEMMSEMEMVRP